MMEDSFCESYYKILVTRIYCCYSVFNLTLTLEDNWRRLQNKNKKVPG
jgi:hypothetical protein